MSGGASRQAGAGSSPRSRRAAVIRATAAAAAAIEVVGHPRPSWRPVHRGGRFSAKAAMPSFWSSVANSPKNVRCSRARPSLSGSSCGRVHRRLGGADRQRRHAPRSVVGQLERPVERLLGRHDQADQPEPLGLAGVDRPPGQDQLHRPGLADRPGQALRAAGAGDDPELDLRLAERRVVTGDDEVALHRELAAAAEGEAAHGRDDRQADRRRGSPSARSRRSAEIVSGVAPAIALMSAPAANAFVPVPVRTMTRQVGSRVEPRERGGQPGHDRRVERVERLAAGRS